MDDEDGSPITNGRTLIEFWERRYHHVPEIVRNALLIYGDRNLKNKWYTKYFAFWNTIDSHLFCFGKLYQPVSYQLGLQTNPGTTLLAGGNEVHAGPPTVGPRMFAFAIGIPEENAAGLCQRYDRNENVGDKDNDGEVQYSPVLLHIDFCCLVFSILEYEVTKSASKTSVREAKQFLVDVLIEIVKDYPMKGYLLQIDTGRVGVRTWLENVLKSLENAVTLHALVEEAIDSDEIFYSPDIIKRRSKKKRISFKANLLSPY